MKKTIFPFVMLLFYSLSLIGQITEEQDQVQNIQDIDIPVSNDVVRWQTFYPEKDILTGIEIILQLVTPTGDLIVELQNFDGSVTILSKSVPASNLTSGSWFRIPFDGLAILEPENVYRIALIRTTAHSTDNEIWWSGGVGSGYPGESDDNGYPDFDYTFSTFNMVYEDELDQHQLIHNYGFAVSHEYDHWQNFLPAHNKITTLYMQFIQINATGTATIALQNFDGSNTLYETTVLAADIPNQDWFRIDFPQAIYLNPDLEYRISVIRSDQHSVGNSLTWRGDYMSDYPGECDVSGSWENYDYAFMTFGFLAAGEKEKYTQSWNCFPNPTGQKLMISIPEQHHGNLYISVSNCLGKQVYSLEYLHDCGNQTLNISDKFSRLEKGTYLLSIRDQNYLLYEQKIIKY